jgi:hypothetical protein
MKRFGIVAIGSHYANTITIRSQGGKGMNAEQHRDPNRTQEETELIVCYTKHNEKKEQTKHESKEDEIEYDMD